MVHARIESGCTEVVGRRDGVDVAGEVKVEVGHGDDLAIAAARRAALYAEGGAHGGLADCGDGLFADVAETLGEADGGGGLAFAQWGWGDGGHVDVFGAAGGLGRFL